MSTQEVNRIENLAGEGVNVAGLAKIEDTGKNICTAWVSFDGTTTPPTILDSFNVSSVARISSGLFSINFIEPMSNSNYSAVVTAANEDVGTVSICGTQRKTASSFRAMTAIGTTAGMANRTLNNIQVFGGKV